MRRGGRVHRFVLLTDKGIGHRPLWSERREVQRTYMSCDVCYNKKSRSRFARCLQSGVPNGVPTFRQPRDTHKYPLSLLSVSYKIPPEGLDRFARMNYGVRNHR